MAGGPQVAPHVTLRVIWGLQHALTCVSLVVSPHAPGMCSCVPFHVILCSRCVSRLRCAVFLCPLRVLSPCSLHVCPPVSLCCIPGMSILHACPRVPFRVLLHVSHIPSPWPCHVSLPCPFHVPFPCPWRVPPCLWYIQSHVPSMSCPCSSCAHGVCPIPSHVPGVFPSCFSLVSMTCVLGMSLACP